MAGMARGPGGAGMARGMEPRRRSPGRGGARCAAPGRPPGSRRARMPRRRARNQGQPGQQPLGRDQPVLLPSATPARSDVPGDPLAPQRAGHPVPVRGGDLQTGAGRFGAQRPHHHPADGELVLHPADADRHVGRGQAERGDELPTVQFPGRLQPPQREQLAVAGVEPAGGLRGLLALAGQAEPQDGELDEVGPGIGHLVGQVGGRGGLPGPVVIAHLADGHRHQPGSERGGIAQVSQAADGPEHGLLDHVVDVGVAAEAAADDVVDEGQVARQEAVQRPGIAGLGGDHRLHPWPAAARHVHGTSPSSA